MTETRPFQFNSDFGDGGHVIPSQRRKRVYVADEVDQMVEQARREGEASALAQSEAAKAHALRQFSDAARAGLAVLSEAAFSHKAQAADLALIAARKVAGAALERFPTAPIEAALEVLSREIEAAPRLVLRLPCAADPAVQEIVEEAARDGGFAGQLVFKDQPGPIASFVIEWPDGRARFDPVEAEASITAAVQAALDADETRGEAPSPELTSPGAY